MSSASTHDAIPGHDVKILTKYERAKIIGMRAEQLARGSQPFVAIQGPFNPCEVAEKELMARVLPFIIVRTMPDGKTEHIKLDTMHVAP